ncbi:recombinase family protein [Nocardia sp. NPDC101769]|uniref:recombinase family protein n=1 Tax=Nocardia sp. NPDC101769 TaxID=3364333 RepID=UPI0038283339
MSPVTVRAVIYLRVSLDTSGEGLAVERQPEDCKRIAEARDWSICEIYTEKPVSAFAEAKKRPAYDRMVEEYRAGRFNALITGGPRQIDPPATSARGLDRRRRGQRAVPRDGQRRSRPADSRRTHVRADQGCGSQSPRRPALV